MNGLSPEQRSSLERTVVGLRKTLEQDLGAVLSGRYGINQDGTIDAAGTLRLGSDEVRLREELLEVLDVLREDSASAGDAVGRLVREAAFTHANRLTAVRIAEATDLLPESLANGRTSTGYHEVLELSPRLREDPFEGYWLYLRWCGDELAPDEPGLFDPRNPLLDLAPSPAALDLLVALLADDALSALWAVPDTLGWAYQFFNTPDERREMRESSAPRDSRELAVRNQFFTPSYVVSFLVENTLGRRLVESYGMAELAAKLPLLVGHDEPGEHARPLEDVRVLDPACGSGHFLLGCYDLLERAWASQGVDAADAAERILPCLYGIDIDLRAAQVATAALVLRARRATRTAALPSPWVVCARALPEDSSAWDRALRHLSPERRRLVDAVREALRPVALLGSLLRAEARLEAEIHAAVPESNASDTLFSAAGLAQDAFSLADSEVLAAAQRVADEENSSAAERLFAADAGDALRFVQAMRVRYDVVLMNPPFGLGVPDAENYLRVAYPETWTELYAAFLVRGRELLNQRGVLGAIVSSQFFTTRTMRAFRKILISECNPLVLIDLGGEVLEGAAVRTCLLVLPSYDRRGPTFYRDLTGTPRDTLHAHISSIADADTVTFQSFESIDNWPLALHLPKALLEHWGAEDRLEPDLAIVRTGNHTFDDFRFLRCRWEAPCKPDDWIPFQKGGFYRPFLAPAHLVLDWRNDGADLKASATERVGSTAQVLQASSLWFRPGLTYSHVSSVGFAARALQSGEIFSSESISIFPNEGVDRLAVLGLLNSTVIAEMLQVFGRSRKFENGAVKALPVGRADLARCQDIVAPVEQLLEIFLQIERLDEVSALFAGFGANGTESAGRTRRLADDLLRRSKECQELLDETASSALGVTGRFDPSVPDRTSLLPRAFPNLKDSGEWAQRIVSYLVGVAFGRWDVRVARGDRPVDPWNMFDPLPVVPPGMFSVDRVSNGYPISLPPSGLLLDERGNEWDLSARVAAAADALAADGSEMLLGAERELPGVGLSDYLRRHFFKDHLGRYSKSHREAPLYWQLSVPSRGWSIWLYAPTLTRETLHGILRHAERRMAVGAEESRRLRQERDAGGGRSGRELDQRLDIEETLLEELRVFRDEAGRLAGLGWDPDLEDGYALVAAMLRRLFAPRAWRKLDQLAIGIADGSFAWASLHEWREHA